jgi:hypothetical protein
MEQVGPAIEPRCVTIIEEQAHCVIANGLDIADSHVLLSGDQNLLARAVPLDLGTWAMRAQELCREGIGFARIELHV